MRQPLAAFSAFAGVSFDGASRKRAAELGPLPAEIKLPLLASFVAPAASTESLER